jgi:hypothetical protein
MDRFSPEISDLILCVCPLATKNAGEYGSTKLSVIGLFVSVHADIIKDRWR